MKLQLNTVTQTMELLFAAKVVSIPNTVKELTNRNGETTQYRIGQVAVTYPGQSTPSKIGCMFWENSLEANGDAFKAGADIEIAVQTEGDFKGYAKAQLPELNRFDFTGIDLEALAEEMEGAEGTTKEVKTEA